MHHNYLLPALGAFFLVVTTHYLSQGQHDTKSAPAHSHIIAINSILEIKELLEKASLTTLIVFDIGETLVIQKNNLLRIFRNSRIFHHTDVLFMNKILARFMRRDSDAKSTLLSNMLLNSPLYLVEPEIKTIIQSLQKRNIKMIAHCSSKAKPFGAIQDFRRWRYTALKNLGIDFSSSFKQHEILLTNLKDYEGFYPIFYKGILFGGTPKPKALSALLDKLNFEPSEIICIDDCEVFIKSYAHELKKNNIPFKGFIYKAPIKETPQLNKKIVDLQVKYMKRKKFIDDLAALKILHKQKTKNRK